MADSAPASPHSRDESPIHEEKQALQLNPADFEVEPDETGLAFIEWLKERLDLPDFAASLWNRRHDAAVIRFLDEQAARRLVAFVDEGGEFHLHLADTAPPPRAPAGPVAFVLRLSEAVTVGDFDQQFQIGVMSRQHLASLLRTMDGVFMPFAHDREAWPEALRLDFMAHTHKFMAALTDAVHQHSGKTVLYIPREQLPPVDRAVDDQALLQRLESTVIHWTRQIKELVGQPGGAAAGIGEAAGPLQEVAFWRRRAEDLSGLSKQLDADGVTSIVAILKAAQSSYLGPFQGLAAAIRRGRAQAEENLRFLSAIEPHCRRIDDAGPDAIPALLPPLLQRLRVIHSLSPFYADKDTMTSLFCRVSNQVIARCRRSISVPAVFLGSIQDSSRVLRQCVACGAAWKLEYARAAAHIARNEPDGGKHWTLDENAIFAQVDAFIQRCRDLIEICTGRLQFMGEATRARAMSVAAASASVGDAGRRHDGGAEAPSPFPVFGGVRGPMVVKSLHEIKNQFRDLLRPLEGAEYDVLDVKGTRWHDDYNSFKSGAKELDRKLQNVITSAFETVTTVDQGVHLLLAFSSFARTPSVRQWVDKKTSEVWQLFMSHLRQARAAFDRLSPDEPLSPTDPRYAGRALAARSLSKRVTAEFEALDGAAELTRVADAEIAQQEYQSLHEQLRGFISVQYRNWMHDLNSAGDGGAEARLENTLLRRALSSAEGAHLETNFDALLNSTFNEVHHWRLFDSEISVPSVAAAVAEKDALMRVAQSSVKDVVRLYNSTLDMLRPDERKLFSDYIRKLDRKVAPGLKKLNWTKQATVERFVHDATALCHATRATFAGFQGKRAAVQQRMDAISSYQLLAIERTRIYTVAEFEARQDAHREESMLYFRRTQREIVDLLVECGQFFAQAAPHIERHWEKFLRATDDAYAEALALCVRRSLLALARATTSDARHAARPIFRLNVVLEDDRKVALSPSLHQFSDMITDATKGMIATTSAVQHLPGLVRRRASQRLAREAVQLEAARLGAAKRGGGGEDEGLPGEGRAGHGDAGEEEAEDRSPQSVFAKIMHTPEVVRQLRHIASAVSATSKRVEAFTQYWHKYAFLWDRPKDLFMQRFEKVVRDAKPESMIASIDTEIARSREHQDSIAAEDQVTKNIDFIQADGGDLKSALMRHCLDWQARYTSLLARLASEQLQAAVAEIGRQRRALAEEPATLGELDDKFQLLWRARGEREATEASFGDLEQMYDMLRRYEVAVPERDAELLEGLRPQFSEFHDETRAADAMLQRCKKAMRIGCEEGLESFVEAVDAMYDEARGARGVPAGKGVELADAVARLATFRERCAVLREREREVAAGLRVFEIEAPDLGKVDKVEAQLEQLKEVWALRAEWEGMWDTWKQQQFRGLDTEGMKNEAAKFNKGVMKLGRAMKTVGAWQDVRERVDQFRDTMPLVEALASEAMRDRHWSSLMDELGERFDPLGPEFTLQRMTEMGLHNLSEFVMELSGIANKELSIEQALVAVGERWRDVEIDMGEYKSYLKIRSTEDLFQTLEDDQVAVSTMKASQFYPSFKEELDEWDGKLGTVSEVMELMLQVQRAWMYLESIFMSSEDIRRQLPTESRLFDGVNAEWVDISTAMKGDRLALAACTRPRLLERLTEMDSCLERIQKSLDQYLETKRQLFPRFYFLSNDDLLEILGQQRDPEQVQKHIKKCFEGIRQLKLERTAAGRLEARGMQSSDGERVAFERPVHVAGAVELWLIEVEKEMMNSLRHVLARSMKTYAGTKADGRAGWISSYPGQLLITTGKIFWTADCTRLLSGDEDDAAGAKAALKKLRKKQIRYLSKLADVVRDPGLSKVNRMKVVALITMEIHSRDVMERMIRATCSNVNDFVWLSQLRFYFEDDAEHEVKVCKTRQTNTNLYFGYEYQGNNGRLVVTPLTDRCILTLTTALHLQRGGNPLGPAGTGKTETVKDLGKNLAKYVVVFNCSDGLDYKSVGRMFSGLVQSGGWGCFDEFNRIEVEVLSVVAQQIMCIMAGIAARQPTIHFEGVEIRCNWNCGIFVTMNPGYAGRSELPDNLKALMRPVAMMTPDLAQIAEVMLMAEGFRDAKDLAKKTVTLYSLMVQQLSKQDHYDYGLRSLKAVLNRAGALKRDEPDSAEDRIVLRALRDMNVPKFIKEDYRLFLLLLGDLFPGLGLPDSDYGALAEALRGEMDAACLQQHDALFAKMIQLYESKLTRHCNMLVGFTMGGKSTVWRTLAAAMTALSKGGNKEFRAVRSTVLNPKSVTLAELYGAYDLSTMEWADGVLSTIFRNCAQDARRDEQWIMLDGPVDTLWIESMNTVMDDNKTLTLINGDRIAMSTQMSLLFEVQDLAVASPATVSRAGMVYVDAQDLGWQPFVRSWLGRKFPDAPGADAAAAAREQHMALFDKYVPPLLLRKERKELRDLVAASPAATVASLCHMLDALLVAKNNVDAAGDRGEAYDAVIERWFAFAVAWTVGASVDEAGRRTVDAVMRELGAPLPGSHPVYDFAIDPASGEAKPWEDRLSQTWRAPPGTPFFRIVVPTVDTVRHSYAVERLMSRKAHVLLVGNTGTGKSVLASATLGSLPDSHTSLIMNFSAATTAGSVQDTVEGLLEKRSKNKFGPPGGRQLVAFVDDLNMPKRDTFGSQPPLELLKQWIDYGGWYDRKKQAWRFVVDMQLLAAMGPPGGGRSEISARIQSRFSMLNLPFPEERQIRRIFEAILTPHLGRPEFAPEIRSMAPRLVQATVLVYHDVVEQFLPTPSKSHYLFNLRDIGKVVQGMLTVGPRAASDADSMLRMWVHESLRVFNDRFTSDADQERFRRVLAARLEETFEIRLATLLEDCPSPRDGPVFVALQGEAGDDGAVPVAEVADLGSLKAFVEEKLEEYNMEPGLVPMELVMFGDALLHVCRIVRILGFPRGNALLVGVGGSGRQSLTRLAAFVKEMRVFQIEIKKNYRGIEFREDLKTLYQLAGVEDKQTVFLFNDTQIKEESFLEDINNILSSGVVPNLYEKDEVTAVLDGVRAAAKAAGMESVEQLWDFFIGRVRDNLHIVLAMSPIGDGFRNRTRMYPSLVNCTTIDWFHPWPEEALQEVAARFLGGVKDLEDELKGRLAKSFAFVHESVAAASERMVTELSRQNYVTPTNYLELVKGYISVLSEKRTEIGDASDKLRNGLAKLEESREQVEEMSKELAKKKVVVAQKQKDCEELLVVIVGERGEAEAKKAQVEGDRERIATEEADCKRIADDAQRDLNKALPALEKAMAEVEKLDKSAISEVKAYSSPPPAVEMVLSAVMVLFGLKTDWATAKKKIGEPNFLQQVKSYDKDTVSNKLMSRVKAYINKPGFTPEDVGNVSKAAAALCVWVGAIYVYGTVFREVAPKREALQKATKSLQAKQKLLATAEAELAEVTAKVAKLQEQYDASVSDKNKYKDEAEMLEEKLARAEQLVTGLGGERERWEASIAAYEVALRSAAGDALLSAGYLSYAGPFDTVYRERLARGWQTAVQGNDIPVSPDYSFAAYMARPTDVRDWNIKGLPRDAFSTENGVIATRGRRWPLMVDPQGQANKWIKNLEGAQLKVCDLKMRDFLRELENAIQFGMPYLLQDVTEELDPSLEPVLTKAIIKVGTREVIRLGDKDVDYSRDFRLYITTKLPNPHYTPEVSTKVTITNFAVKEQGLEAQLLGIVVQEEKPSLEQQKSELVVRVAAGKRKLVDLENEILRLLSAAQGSLLDDDELVKTLQASKVTAEEVSAQLQESEETEKKIDAARMGYKAVSTRASILFFVLNDLGRVDPMYQFALDAYVNLFVDSIVASRAAGARGGAKSGAKVGLAARIEAINSYHTYAVYKYACRGLFERHKLLLSMQMCSKKMEQEGVLDGAEYSFFLRGGIVMDRSEQAPNPCPAWLDAVAWDNLTEIDKLPSMSGIAGSFEQAAEDWRRWYLSPAPESEELPGEWSERCNELQRMCVVRSLRQDRVLFAASRFVANNLGAQYVEPPAFDLDEIHGTSTSRVPLIFVLSPGVDPIKQVQALADQKGKTLLSVALGQGQAPIATQLIEEGIQRGHWVFLANCHLMVSWMPTLEKIVEGFATKDKPHPEFRLWLSSSPTDKFPIAILQRGIKMTTEPPQGLRANMVRLYNLMTEEQFERCTQKARYKKLLFSLCWFHSVLLERRKFKSLGFNIPYEFNDSDFAICEDILRLYLDEYPESVPWDALRYLVAEANYGGRVTDDWDRRLVNVYIEQFFCDEAVSEPRFRLSELDTYYIPDDGKLAHYKDVIRAYPARDKPQAFGQHPNADIASMIENAKELLSTVVDLQPRSVAGGGESDEDKVLRMAAELEGKVPPPFDLRDIRDALAARDDPDPLKTVLLQELERYNALLLVMARSLAELQKGIQGLVVITPELEEVLSAVLLGRVPASWGFCYPSLKPLGPWMTDLLSRIAQMRSWADDRLPTTFWLSGFTYPTGFLTALMQTSARKNGVAIDSLSWEFPVLTQEPGQVKKAPEVGAYVYGMFLEGARWDADSSCLASAAPMELFAPMPMVHFKPTEGKRKTSKHFYVCPLYLYPLRTGTRERPSFMTSVELKAGAVSPTFWTKRGTALLLSLAM